MVFVNVTDATLTGSVVSTSIVIEAPVEEVWRALTDPARLKQWFFGADTRTDWRVGGPITHRGEYQGRPYEDKGVVVAFDEPMRLSFTHWSAASGRPDTPEAYQTVTFRLVREGTVTRLSLTEQNLASPQEAALSETRWEEALRDLKYLLEPE